MFYWGKKEINKNMFLVGLIKWPLLHPTLRKPTRGSLGEFESPSFGKHYINRFQMAPKLPRVFHKLSCIRLQFI